MMRSFVPQRSLCDIIRTSTRHICKQHTGPGWAAASHPRPAQLESPRLRAKDGLIDSVCLYLTGYVLDPH